MNALPDPRPQESHQDRGSTDESRGSSSGGLHAWLMPLCLILMGGAFVLVMWRGQTAGGAWLLLPMLLCLGMHFLMHRHGHGHRHRDE